MKYMGSKNRIAKHILPFLQESVDRTGKYLEPFVGGANMIDKIVCDFRVGCDYNEYIASMWEMLESGWKPPEQVSSDEYKKIRDNKDSYPKHLVGWVGINCSYSGKWFGGYAGITRTKGGVRDYYKEALANVMKQVPNIVGVEFKHENFFNLNVTGYTIYCDPPYRGTTGYKDEIDYEKFYVHLLRLAKNNEVFISEYSMPEQFKELWSRDVVSSLSANGKAGGSKQSTEKLFSVP